MPVKVGLNHIEIWDEYMEPAIAAYEQEPQHQGQIVFYGPSYFTRWSTKYGMKPLRECLLGASGAPCAVNRGFGSSCAEQQLYYYPRAIRPLNPKVPGRSVVYHIPDAPQPDCGWRMKKSAVPKFGTADLLLLN